ncbi:cilia- and flagella-associated protein 53 isoform X2 [Sorex araneus]|uniref:cilia- and flagella-associated protein 53 isoform X2 n=1 Tax=Sorex araneus TaxID=42254 RepID=UPI002433927D|nr:cilia- and flagella-associated protein 53 isoform X2 [Sorex araneus]
MYSQRFGIVPREIKGPTPKVVILRAKPPKDQRRDRLKDIVRSQQKYHGVLAAVKERERERSKVEWEQHMDKISVNRLVRSRVKDAMQGFILNTEERRNKLRKLLAAEENEYFEEMQLKEDKIEERKNKMKEKISLLRAEKEKERQNFVAEKLDQQFRDNSEALRNAVTFTRQQKVAEERKAQVAFNEELRRRKLEEEQIFSRLWEEDRLAKEMRNNEEMLRQRQLVENTRLGLDAQVTGMRAQRMAARRLKEEEALLVENEIAQVKHENEVERLEKLKAKQDTRASLNKALREKMARVQQEFREQQDLDLKLVHSALQDIEEETHQKKQRKEELKREQKLYNQYLAERREEERAHEKELDRILEEEKKKKMAEQESELRLEKEARKQLIDEVMCTRKLQVQEKLQRKAREQEELALEQERINEGLKVLNREERETFARRCRLMQEYRKQLQMQISYQQQAQEAKKEEERREFEAGLAEQKIFTDKLTALLRQSHALFPRSLSPTTLSFP